MPVSPETLCVLAVIVVGAQLVETATGFGATVMALALGAHFLPLDTWVVTLVLIALLQSSWLVARNVRHIELGLLLKRILPLCALGLVVGRMLFSVLDLAGLQVVLGCFVVTVAVLELVRLQRGKAAGAALPAPVAGGLLLGGGIVHGLFASGGPLVVYYVSRRLPDKRRFRATLSLLWLLLNTTLAITHGASGRLNGATLQLAGAILPALVMGIVLGEILHKRMNDLLFRKVVQGVLLVTGVFLLV